MPPTSSREQFDRNASKYAASSVHQHGPSLPVLLELAAPQASERALDVATGTGNTALALAERAGSVTGLDLSPGMLAQARARAEREAASNVSFLEGAAESLPFADGSFDIVTSRHAPHHFHDLSAFLREARRVLAPAGRIVIADQVTPAPEYSEWVDYWQRTRDPSHYRQRTVQEWREQASAARLRWVTERIVPYRLDFAWWVQQSGCQPETVRALEAHAEAADQATREALGLEFDADRRILAHREPMLVVRLEA